MEGGTGWRGDSGWRSRQWRQRVEGRHGGGEVRWKGGTRWRGDKVKGRNRVEGR